MLLGIPASGLYTNGYSLARRAFRIDEKPSIMTERLPDLGQSLGKALMEPHRGYYWTLKPLLCEMSRSRTAELVAMSMAVQAMAIAPSTKALSPATVAQ